MQVSMMLAPLANASYSTTSGQLYNSNQYNLIAPILSSADQTDLINQGCSILYPSTTGLLFVLKQANFNVGGAGATGDQLISPLLNAQTAKFRITKITVLNTSVNGMSTAAGGFYTGAGKTGTTLVLASQAYTGLTNASTALDLTLNAPNAILPANQSIYMSLTTPQGAPATADVYVRGEFFT